jgi:hypothetical protein
LSVADYDGKITIFKEKEIVNEFKGSYVSIT